MRWKAIQYYKVVWNVTFFMECNWWWNFDSVVSVVNPPSKNRRVLVVVASKRQRIVDVVPGRTVVQFATLGRRFWTWSHDIRWEGDIQHRECTYIIPKIYGWVLEQIFCKVSNCLSWDQTRYLNMMRSLMYVPKLICFVFASCLSVVSIEGYLKN